MTALRKSFPGRRGERAKSTIADRRDEKSKDCGFDFRMLFTKSAVRSFLVDRIYRLVPSSDGGDDFVGIGDPLEARERVVG